MFIGCSIPGNGIPHAFTSKDKLLHIGIFILFGYLWRRVGYSVRSVLIAGIVYGLLIEIWQGIMPINRSFDVYDIVADSVGAALGVGAAEVLKRISGSRTAK